MHWTQWALLGARLIPGGVLILAGFSKVAMGPAGFTRVVQAYKLLPARWSRVVALTLPPVEVAAGTLVVLGAFSQLGALVAILVLGVVTAAAGSALVRGVKAPCGCFGEFTTTVTSTVIARNGVLMALLVPDLVLGGGAFSLDAIPAIRWYIAAAVVAGFAVVAVARAKGGDEPSLPAAAIASINKGAISS
jgi:uncharacterized membrane protein YphA (DoxX/SURF4 family)